MFWIISILLMAAASLFVLLPLWQHFRPSKDSDSQIRTDANLTIFEERQQELEADLAIGNLDQKQFDSLFLELKKTLLIDTGGENIVQTKSKSKPSKKGPVRKSDPLNKLVPLFMALLIPVIAYFMYDQWGYLDDVELMDFYERSISSSDDPEESRELVITLGQVVQEDEENEWAWYFLGRNFANLGMFPEAEIAFQRASDLMPDGPDKAATLGLYAQIKYVTSGGALTDEVQALLDRALAINPAEFASLQLLSLDAENRGDYQAAIGYWRLMIQVNPNSQQARELRNSIAAAQQILAGSEGVDGQVGPRIEVNVQLAEELEFPPELRVFVAARNAEQEGLPPLAAIDLLVGDLPATVTLDNNLAVGPFNLSSATTIFVTATVSRSGSATVQSGDFRVVSQNFAHNGEHSIIDLIISEAVP